MYFGFDRMWTLSFVPAGFVVVMVASVALGAVYAVGAARGGQPALAYARACSWSTVAAIGAVLVFGVWTGQWARFMEWYGPWPMVEMGLLAFMWLATMWLMAVSYARGRARQDKRNQADPAGAGSGNTEG